MVDEVLGRHVEVDVLGTARMIRPRAAERGIKVLWRVEIQAKRRQVLSERQRDEVRIGFRCSDEGEKTHHAELIGYHVGGDVTDSAVGCRPNSTCHVTTTLKKHFFYLNNHLPVCFEALLSVAAVCDAVTDWPICESVVATPSCVALSSDWLPAGDAPSALFCVPGSAGKSSFDIVNSLDSDVG